MQEQPAVTCCHYLESDEWTWGQISLQGLNVTMFCTQDSLELLILLDYLGEITKGNLDLQASFYLIGCFSTRSAALLGSPNRTWCACRQANSSFSLLSGGIQGRPVQTQSRVSSRFKRHPMRETQEADGSQSNLSQTVTAAANYR